MQEATRPLTPEALTRTPAARQAALVLLFGALTALSAQVAIPFHPVPLTGQVFMVLVAGAVLGPRLGFLSQLAYMAIGFAGAPVFAGGKASALVLLGPTAGYLVAFPLAAWVAGTLTARCRSVLGLLGSLALADALILLLGGTWLGVGSALGMAGVPHSASLPEGVALGFRIGTLPFLVPEAVKVMAATLATAPLLERRDRSW